jgi:hypothetical protein
MISATIRKHALEANALADEIRDVIRPMLAGRDPGVQGGALADLLALWLAGHPPFVREAMIEMHIEMVRDLIPVNEHIIFGPEGHPQKEPL